MNCMGNPNGTSTRTVEISRSLVAGATGYPGGFVVRELKRRGYFVRALARAPEKLECLRESVDEVVRGDVTRPESLDSVCEGIDVGGPQTMRWREVAALAFKAVEKPVRISRIPGWLMWCVVGLLRFFSRHQGELLAFSTTMATTDVVAPATGSHTLGAYYRAMGGNP